MNNLINIIDTPLKNADDDKLNTRKYVEGLAQYLTSQQCRLLLQFRVSGVLEKLPL